MTGTPLEGLSRPDFLGIGSHRAGTTWLYEQLSRSPRVWLPPVKELHYFDRSPRYPSPSHLAVTSPLRRTFGASRPVRQWQRRGLRQAAQLLSHGDLTGAGWRIRFHLRPVNDQWYTTLFAAAPAGVPCGEITPAYSILDDADVSRIVQVAPQARVILLLRDPVDRAWSNIRLAVMRNEASPSAIRERLDREGVRARSDSIGTLQRYLRHFPPDQILVGFFDAIVEQPRALLHDIGTFLGVGDLGVEPTAERVNAATAQSIPDDIRGELVARLRPQTEALAKVFGGYPATWSSDRPTGEGELPPASVRLDRVGRLQSLLDAGS